METFSFGLLLYRQFRALFRKSMKTSVLTTTETLETRELGLLNFILTQVSHRFLVSNFMRTLARRRC